MRRSPIASGDRIKVLYITGYGRSGSTLLSSLLDQVDAFFGTGELQLLWRPGEIQRNLCGCGRPVLECDVWSAVLAAVAGKDLAATAERVARWQRETLLPYHPARFARILRHSAGQPSRWPALDGHLAISDLLYRSIAGITGARVIVDCSKGAAGAAMLRLLPSVDPYFVHLIRDPRGVVYSGLRRKGQATASGWRTKFRRGGLYSTFMWIEYNLASEAVCRRLGVRGARVRYEDLIAEPKTTVDSIVRMTGEDAELNALEDGQTVQLSSNHTVAGNPSRFETGRITLRKDVEWQRRMSSHERILVTAATAPLLLRYGYPLRPLAGGTSTKPTRTQASNGPLAPDSIQRELPPD